MNTWGDFFLNLCLKIIDRNYSKLPKRLLCKEVKLDPLSNIITYMDLKL